MPQFQVVIERLITTTVDVEANDPEAAKDIVDRVDFVLPQPNDWHTVEGDEYRVLDMDGNEIEEG